MLSRLFYGPGDWLAQAAARTRRAIAAWMLIVCLFPGVPLWLVLRNALWFVGFMSIIALVFGAWGVLSAETPVEPETVEQELCEAADATS